ncbi:unnamed protein product [Brassica oleracea]
MNLMYDIIAYDFGLCFRTASVTLMCNDLCMSNLFYERVSLL